MSEPSIQCWKFGKPSTLTVTKPDFAYPWSQSSNYPRHKVKLLLSFYSSQNTEIYLIFAVLVTIANVIFNKLSNTNVAGLI